MIIEEKLQDNNKKSGLYNFEILNGLKLLSNLNITNFCMTYNAELYLAF